MLQLDGKYYMRFNAACNLIKQTLIKNDSLTQIISHAYLPGKKFIKRLKGKADKIGLPSCVQKATKSFSQPKQPFRVVLMYSVFCNMYSENMQQIYCNFIEFLRGFHSIFCNILCNIAQYFCIVISRLSSYS